MGFREAFSLGLAVEVWKTFSVSLGTSRCRSWGFFCTGCDRVHQVPSENTIRLVDGMMSAKSTVSSKLLLVFDMRYLKALSRARNCSFSIPHREEGVLLLAGA